MTAYRLGLVGYALSHSLSPKIHTAALQSCGLRGDYSLFPIHPDNKEGLEELLAQVRSGEIHGLNVTIPHKQNVIPFLDELTPTAKSIGAVNTIYVRDNKLVGGNTDAPGFLVDLKKFLTTETHTCPGGKCQGRHGDAHALVLGAGGAARAIICDLLNNGWDVTIAARRLEQAQQLALSFPNYELLVTNFESLQADFRPVTFDLLVNTTPVGMTPNTGQSPWPENLPFPSHAVIYDLVYNPRETKLVKDACSQGLRATTGLGMLIEQAALAFEIWTGRNPPREKLWNAIDN